MNTTQTIGVVASVAGLLLTLSGVESGITLLLVGLLTFGVGRMFSSAD
jgi:hypothetical protein